MNLQLNYHHLRYFLAVAQEGGITAASEALHVSPPTLSAQVRELESSLGVELFSRQGKSLVLTDVGRVLRRYAERIFGLGDEMIEVVKRGGEGGAETVHLGVVDAVPKLLAAQLLTRAWEESPGLRVVVREGMPGELFPALAAHQVDMVIANEPAPTSLKALVFSERAGRFGVHFAASADLCKTYKSRKGLEGFPVLVPTRESPLRRELDRWWRDHGTQPDIRAEFDDAAAMWELAAGGLGATPVVAPVLADVLMRYQLVELPVRLDIHEELFVVTADRQFTHEGARILARLARTIPEPRPPARKPTRSR